MNDEVTVQKTATAFRRYRTAAITVGELEDFLAEGGVPREAMIWVDSRTNDGTHVRATWEL